MVIAGFLNSVATEQIFFLKLKKKAFTNVRDERVFVAAISGAYATGSFVLSTFSLAFLPWYASHLTSLVMVFVWLAVSSVLYGIFVKWRVICFIKGATSIGSLHFQLGLLNIFVYAGYVFFCHNVSWEGLKWHLVPYFLAGLGLALGLVNISARVLNGEYRQLRLKCLLPSIGLSYLGLCFILAIALISPSNMKFPEMATWQIPVDKHNQF